MQACLFWVLLESWLWLIEMPIWKRIPYTLPVGERVYRFLLARRIKQQQILRHSLHFLGLHGYLMGPSVVSSCWDIPNIPLTAFHTIRRLEYISQLRPSHPSYLLYTHRFFARMHWKMPLKTHSLFLSHSIVLFWGKPWFSSMVYHRLNGMVLPIWSCVLSRSSQLHTPKCCSVFPVVLSTVHTIQGVFATNHNHFLDSLHLWRLSCGLCFFEALLLLLVLLLFVCNPLFASWKLRIVLTFLSTLDYIQCEELDITLSVFIIARALLLNFSHSFFCRRGESQGIRHLNSLKKLCAGLSCFMSLGYFLTNDSKSATVSEVWNGRLA